MAVFRVHKTKDFTVMSNYHLRDKSLTLKAKGLLSVILSLPDDWKYSIAGLAAICKEGTSAVKSALQELADAGYVTVTKLYPNQTETGRIEYVYDIHERPQAPRKQGIENLPLESQQVENQRQLNTEKPSTDKSNTKKKNICHPTIEDVRAYVNEKGYRFDPDQFFAYYDSSGWRMQNGKRVRNWKQCCVTWERNSKGKEKSDGAIPEYLREYDYPSDGGRRCSQDVHGGGAEARAGQGTLPLWQVGEGQDPYGVRGD